MSERPHDGVASPCISVCVMDPDSGLCMGCLRTLDEIALWSVLDDPDKRTVLSALPARRRRFDAAIAARIKADGER